jgi:inosose dehydratase
VKTLKIAGAPISWGVCEVPGWGHQLAPERVLAEMREVGLSATELGPEGFLPSDPGELSALLGSYGLSCVGTFAPMLLHDAGHDPLRDIAGPLDALAACGADVLVLAAATGADGYDSRPALDDDQWATLLTNLDRLAEAAANRGMLGAPLPLNTADAVENMAYVDAAYRAAGMSPR